MISIKKLVVPAAAGAVLSMDLYALEPLNIKGNIKGRSAETSGRRLRDIVAEKFPKGNVYIGATSTFSATEKPAGKILAREFSYITPANDYKPIPTGISQR